MIKKRLALFFGVLASLVVVLSGTASAQDDHGATVTVNHNPVSWTLTWQQCPNLPTGITLTGEGQEVFISERRTDRDGVIHLHETSKKTGSVVDNVGNNYRFDYLNTTRSTSSDGGLIFTGIMHDVFSVLGNGPGTLRNGFEAQIAFNTTFTYFVAVPIPGSVFGDPFQFPSGPGICDPI